MASRRRVKSNFFGDFWSSWYPSSHILAPLRKSQDLVRKFLAPPLHNSQISLHNTEFRSIAEQHRDNTVLQRPQQRKEVRLAIQQMKISKMEIREELMLKDHKMGLLLPLQRRQTRDVLGSF